MPQATSHQLPSLGAFHWLQNPMLTVASRAFHLALEQQLQLELPCCSCNSNSAALKLAICNMQQTAGWNVVNASSQLKGFQSGVQNSSCSWSADWVMSTGTSSSSSRRGMPHKWDETQVATGTATGAVSAQAMHSAWHQMKYYIIVSTGIRSLAAFPLVQTKYVWILVYRK